MLEYKIRLWLGSAIFAIGVGWWIWFLRNALQSIPSYYSDILEQHFGNFGIVDLSKRKIYPSSPAYSWHCLGIICFTKGQGIR